MNSRPLNADELGEKGQSRFCELCADAGLVCNPSTRDRTGWDFLVEFPFPARLGQPTLDERNSPLSCHVQVKTIWSSNDRCTLRLSSAERLAKDIKPTFVCVLRANENLDFEDAYLIHLLDRNLETVLRRLRKEQASGNIAVNKKLICFRPTRDGRPFQLAGPALYAAIVECCGSDLSFYSERKVNQLKTLGFESDRRIVKVGIQFEGDDIADVFLGLKKAKFVHYEEIETRFGIALPVERPFPHIPFEVTPIPVDRGEVVFRDSDQFSFPALFKVDVIVPPLPGLAFSKTKIVIRSKFFQFVVHGKTSSVDFTTFDVSDEDHSLDDWINFFRMMMIVLQGKGSVTLRSKGKILPLPFGRNPESSSKIDAARKLLSAVIYVRSLFALAATDEPRLRLAEIEDQCDEIISVGELFARKPGADDLSFDGPENESAGAPEERDLLYASYLRFRDLSLCYYAITRMVGKRDAGRTVWRSEKFELQELKVIKLFPDDYVSFLEKIKASTGISVIMAKPFDSNPLTNFSA